MKRDAILLVIVTAIIVAAVGASAFASVQRSGETASNTAKAIVLTGGDSGCGQGFWKNHPSAWMGTFLSPTQTVESVFDVPNAYGLDNVTLLGALGLPGDRAPRGRHRSCCGQGRPLSSTRPRSGIR